VIEDLARQFHPDVFPETTEPEKQTDPLSVRPKPTAFLPATAACSLESPCAR
jgi:hypothetical protein